MHARLERHHYLNLPMGIDSLHVTYLCTYLRHLQFHPIYVNLVQDLRTPKRLVDNLGQERYGLNSTAVNVNLAVGFNKHRTHPFKEKGSKETEWQCSKTN